MFGFHFILRSVHAKCANCIKSMARQPIERAFVFLFRFRIRVKEASLESLLAYTSVCRLVWVCVCVCGEYIREPSSNTYCKMRNECIFFDASTQPIHPINSRSICMEIGNGKMPTAECRTENEMELLHGAAALARFMESQRIADHQEIHDSFYSFPLHSMHALFLLLASLLLADLIFLFSSVARSFFHLVASRELLRATCCFLFLFILILWLLYNYCVQQNIISNGSQCKG